MKRKSEVAGPVVPFARVTGRLVLPDGRGGAGGSLTFDPLPCNVRAVTSDGPAVVAASVRITLDNEGRVSSDAGPFVDVIGCGEGVKPAGEWAYLVRLTGPGVAWTGVAVLKAGKTYDLTDILAGVLAGSDGGGVIAGEALEALAARVDELAGKMASLGDSEAVKALTEKLAAVESELREAASAEKARLDELKENAITSDDLDNVLDGGLYGSFPYVQRSQGKPAEQYGATTISESFGTLAQTVIAADKDLHAVKNGPYLVPYVGSDGQPAEPQESDLEGALSTVSAVFADLGGTIRNIASEVVQENAPGEPIPGPAGPQGEPGPAGPAGPQGEPGVGVREQTAWTKLTDLPANLTRPGDGNGVYVRRHGGIVYMAIRGANPAAGLVKFDVPEGYRHSFSMAAMGVLIPCDDAKLAGKLQFRFNKGFEWKGAAGVTDLGYGVLSYPTNDPWPES